MIADWLQEQSRLRDEAWAEVQALPAFKALQAFDAAVVALGGQSVLALNHTTQALVANNKGKAEQTDTQGARSKTALGDIALQVLEAEGRPMSFTDLFQMSQHRGLSMSGKDPRANFRSALSRDSRLKAHGESNKFHWWFADRELPGDWDEAEPNMLHGLNGSASSSHSSQEGGDGHAANNTDLAS
jgi:hypothetical protein